MENQNEKPAKGFNINDSIEDLKHLPGRCKAALRHENVWGFLVSMAVILIVSIAFFYPDNIDGNSLAQHDMLQGTANGEEARAYEELTGEKALWTNALFSGMPTFQISPEYPSNSLFTWINSVYGLGLPAPSNLLFMMMFGFLIMLSCLRLRWWYALIGALAWGLSSYFIIIIGAGHIWKFVALAYVPPTIAGFILIYRGRRLGGAALLALFMMMELNANHPQITYYFAFLMLFLGVAFLVQAGMNRRLKQWLVSTCVVIVAGGLAAGANLPSLYNTYEYSKETKRASSELTPVKDTDAPVSTERPTGGLPKSEIGGWSNLPEESLSLLIPNIKGGASIKPEPGQPKLLSLGETDSYRDVASKMPEEANLVMYNISQYFGGKDMTNGPFYVGALILALFILGCFIVKGPIKWVLLVATVFSAMLAMGNHFSALTDFMIYNVPLYNKFRAAETALVIACLCIPLLAMMALKKLFTMENPLKNKQVQLGLSVAFIFPLFICFVAYISPSVLGSAITDQDVQMFNMVAGHYGYDLTPMWPDIEKNIVALRYEIVSADALRSIWILILGAVVIYLALTKRLGRGLACICIGLIVTIDLYSLDKRYVDHDSFDSSLSLSEAVVADNIDREIMQDKGYYRVVDFANFSDARRSYFHKMIGGYHAAKLNRYNDLIERQKIALPGVLNMLNTKYFIGQTTDPSTGQPTVVYQQNPDAWGPAWLASHIDYVEGADAEFAALDSLKVPGRVVADTRFKEALGEADIALSEGDYIKLDQYTPNKLTYTVDTRKGGVAVFSEVWFPWGWTAAVDGKEEPLGRVNYVLRAIRVPAGKHTVVMTFDPQSLHTTGSLAYSSVTLIYLLCLAAIFFTCIRRKKNNDTGKNV